MCDEPQVVPAQLVPGLQLKIQRHTIATLPCPKCDRDMGVTGVKEGHSVTCPGCENVTIVPSYAPKWRHKMRNYTISLSVSFIAGIGAGFVVNLFI